MKMCKDGRIWGQNNKEAQSHLGILFSKRQVKGTVPSKTFTYWTEEEIERLKTLYPHAVTTREISLALPPRTAMSIRMKAYHLGIRGNSSRSGCQTEHLPIEVKRKLSQSLKGRVFSEEHKRKISESERRQFEDPEYRQWRITRSRSGLFHKPNKAELHLKAVLDHFWPGDWQYVGDGKVIIEGLCPDFINCNGKKQIIELFGRNFHDPKVTYLERIPYHRTEEGRREIFAKYGYQTLIIWDDELKKKEGGEIISEIKNTFY